MVKVIILSIWDGEKYLVSFMHENIRQTWRLNGHIKSVCGALEEIVGLYPDGIEIICNDGELKYPCSEYGNVTMIDMHQARDPIDPDEDLENADDFLERVVLSQLV